MPEHQMTQARKSNFLFLSIKMATSCRTRYSIALLVELQTQRSDVEMYVGERSAVAKEHRKFPFCKELIERAPALRRFISILHPTTLAHPRTLAAALLSGM